MGKIEKLTNRIGQIAEGDNKLKFYSIIILMLVFALIMIGRLTVRPNHMEICQDEINTTKELLNQITLLETALIQNPSGDITCDQVNDGICAQKINKMKEEYKSLRCKICDMERK